MSSDLGSTRHGYKWMLQFVELLLMEENPATPEISHRYQKWPYLKGVTISKAHHFGYLAVSFQGCTDPNPHHRCHLGSPPFPQFGRLKSTGGFFAPLGKCSCSVVKVPKPAGVSGGRVIS